MFDDDSTACTCAQSMHQLVVNIQDESDRIHQWSQLNGMNTHAGKTKILIISKKLFIGPIPKITMDNRALESPKPQNPKTPKPQNPNRFQTIEYFY